jgi:hypothetical protein
MTFEPISDRLLHKLERSLDPSIPTSAFPGAPAPPARSPAPFPTAVFLLSDVPSQPLTWLWPGRIPLGHLTLLDAAPGCGLSLLALTLAACVSRGSPLPDGTPTQQGTVILLAPSDSASDTIKPRLSAAGGDPAHVLLFHPLVEDASHALSRTRPFALPHDLDHLATMIRCLEARLVILDPVSAIPGLSGCLPALIELAHQTNCAILLTRSLQKPPADPLHSPPPTSPLLQASRSRLLLTSDPADERHHLLLTTRHPLCTQPSILAYDILASTEGIPLIHWLGERDHFHLARLCTGPLHSPHRQAILRFLHNSPSPQSIPEILQATSYDEEAGRKMLVRMKMAGELVSPARGLYTTANHPCLAPPTADAPPVPNVPTVPEPAGEVSQDGEPSHADGAGTRLIAPTVPETVGEVSQDGERSHTDGVRTLSGACETPVILSEAKDLAPTGWGGAHSPTVSVPNVTSVPSSQTPASDNSSQCDIPPVPDTAGELTETRVGADLSCPSPIDRPVSPPVCSPAVSVPTVPITDDSPTDQGSASSWLGRGEGGAVGRGGPLRSPSSQCDIRPTPAVPITDHLTTMIPTDPPVPTDEPQSFAS